MPQAWVMGPDGKMTRRTLVYRIVNQSGIDIPASDSSGAIPARGPAYKLPYHVQRLVGELSTPKFGAVCLFIQQAYDNQRVLSELPEVPGTVYLVPVDVARILARRDVLGVSIEGVIAVHPLYVDYYAGL